MHWQDSDVSIRKRALDLVYALVNESNVKVLFFFFARKGYTVIMFVVVTIITQRRCSCVN
jgi:hypothetical protein